MSHGSESPQASRQAVADAQASSGPSPERGLTLAVGAAALGLAASIVAQNVAVAVTPAPTYADPIAKVLAFHAEHPTAVAIAVGLEAVNLPLLLGFLTGLHGLVGRQKRASAHWSRLAMVAGAALSGILALYAVLWIGVVLAAKGLAEPTPLLQVVWQMHAAALALAFPALGTTFIGAALAAHSSGLTPRRQALMGVVGGGLLIVAGTGCLAIADGSAFLYVGIPGYAAWLVWLLATGIRLVRRGLTAP